MGGGGDNSPCHETEPRRENILFLFRHGARGHSSVALMAVVTFLLVYVFADKMRDWLKPEKCVTIFEGI